MSSIFFFHPAFVYCKGKHLWKKNSVHPTVKDFVDSVIAGEFW